ncbi:MAG: hypothetical protein HYY52_00775 [Candidatus Melainabacteria bacterium]|nr:hypothetical protein [Candidatus Melainabacteria bacterium]
MKPREVDNTNSAPIGVFRKDSLDLEIKNLFATGKGKTKLLRPDSYGVSRLIGPIKINNKEVFVLCDTHRDPYAVDLFQNYYDLQALLLKAQAKNHGFFIEGLSQSYKPTDVWDVRKVAIILSQYYGISTTDPFKNFLSWEVISKLIGEGALSKPSFNRDDILGMLVYMVVSTYQGGQGIRNACESMNRAQSGQTSAEELITAAHKFNDLLATNLQEAQIRYNSFVALRDKMGTYITEVSTQSIVRELKSNDKKNLLFICGFLHLPDVLIGLDTDRSLATSIITKNCSHLPNEVKDRIFTTTLSSLVT